MIDEEEQLETISLDRAQLETICSNQAAFFGLDISRLSMIFMAQLLRIHLKRIFNIYQILDEVRALENEHPRTGIKKADYFKHEPLRGLMKTHFMDARFILKNIGNHMGMEKGGNKRLDKLIKDAFAQNKSGVVDDEFVGFISQGMSIGAMEERSRAGKMTGEWIVFQQDAGKNYYLTLASHKESDDEIYKRVCDCYDLDFSHLRQATSCQA